MEFRRSCLDSSIFNFTITVVKWQIEQTDKQNPEGQYIKRQVQRYLYSQGWKEFQGKHN